MSYTALSECKKKRKKKSLQSLKNRTTNGVIDSQKKELILKRPKGVVSNSRLTFCTNIRRLVTKKQNKKKTLPLVFTGCSRTSCTLTRPQTPQLRLHPKRVRFVSRRRCFPRCKSKTTLHRLAKDEDIKRQWLECILKCYHSSSTPIFVFPSFHGRLLLKSSLTQGWICEMIIKEGLYTLYLDRLAPLDHNLQTG